MGNIDLGPIFILSIIGLCVVLVALGAGVGALLALPFCLWNHDFTMMLWPTVGGGVVGLGLFAWMFRRGF